MDWNPQLFHLLFSCPSLEGIVVIWLLFVYKYDSFLRRAYSSHISSYISLNEQMIEWINKMDGWYCSSAFPVYHQELQGSTWIFDSSFHREHFYKTGCVLFSLISNIDFLGENFWNTASFIKLGISSCSVIIADSTY